MRVLLVSCYELGHQPLHVAAPAALIRAKGHDVRCRDLAVEPWNADDVDWADRIAFSVPMHTATRIAREAIAGVRARRPELPIACYGLYAGTVADRADRAIAGEADEALVAWIDGDDDRSVVHLDRSAARSGAPAPARDLLPPLEQYAHLLVGDGERGVGYVEASHGCAHRCRHCPVPVVYDGRIRVVDADAVLADVRQQVGLGARHITFGDPDFFNGVHHSMRVARAVHSEFPDLTFDCTVKVEHVLRDEDVWGELAALGCLFVVSAFECVDDETLVRLDKGHITADASRAVRVLRRNGIEVRPSWMPFTPWTTLTHIQELLEFVADHDLVGNVDPVQYTIRLLLPQGSLLLDHPDLAPNLGQYDTERASYAWTATDPSMDALQAELAALVEAGTDADQPISVLYDAVRMACGLAPLVLDPGAQRMVPRLSEPWFCCAEPTALQLDALR